MWFGEPGAGPAFARPVDMAVRSSQLRVKINITLPEPTEELLTAAEKYATAAGFKKSQNQWWEAKWRYVQEKGGPSFRNGFRVKEGGGYHYALTESGLAEANPQITGGTSDIEAALAAKRTANTANKIKIQPSAPSAQVSAAQGNAKMALKGMGVAASCRDGARCTRQFGEYCERRRPTG